MKFSKQYSEEVSQIRAIALAFNKKQLTMKNLAKGLLISDRGRVKLTSQLNCHISDLRKVRFDENWKFEDNPKISWPSSMDDEDISFFDAFDEDDKKDSEKEDKSPTFYDLDLLVEKTCEAVHDEYFFKHEIAESLQEFEKLMAKALKDTLEKFPYESKSIESLMMLLKVQGRRMSLNKRYRHPFPIFAFRFGSNNEQAIIQNIAKNLQCRNEQVDLKVFDKEQGHRKLYEYPPALIVFNMTTQIGQNDETDQFLTALESDSQLTSSPNTEDIMSISLFNNSDFNEIQRIIDQNLYIILIRLPDYMYSYKKLDSKELTGLLRKHYEKNEQESIKSSDNTLRLLDLINNNNNMIFSELEYKAIHHYVKHYFNNGFSFLIDVSNKLPFSQALNMAIIRSGATSLKDVTESLEIFYSQLQDLVGKHKDATVHIRCNNQQIKALFNDDTENEIHGFNTYQAIIDEIVNNRKSFTYEFKYDSEEKSILITNFEPVYSSNFTGSSYLTERPTIRFRDVVGMENVKERFRIIESFYKNPKLFSHFKTEPVNRILLVGEPGTGKTYIARAFAGETGLPFFSISASEVTSQKYAGFGGVLLRDIFNVAMANKPCILFLDELDAFGKRDDMTGDSVGYDAKAILNTLLVSLDGISSDNNIIVIGATNRFEDLDNALTRPKRFGTVLHTNGLSAKEREQLIKMRITPEMCQDSLDEIARYIINKTDEETSAAMIEEIINEAKLLAIRGQKARISKSDFESVINQLILGDKLTDISPELKESIAYYQSGHLIAHKLLFQSVGVEEISISLREKSFGLFNISKSDYNIDNLNPESLLKMVISLISGALAEKAKFGFWSLHAEDDWEFAIELCRKIIGNIEITSNNGVNMIEYFQNDGYTDSQVNYVNKVLTFCKSQAYQIIEDNWAEIEIVAHKLLQQESLKKQEIEHLVHLGDFKMNELMEELIAQLRS